MIKKSPTRTIAFVVPTLSDAAAQREDVVQLLVFAAAELEQWLTEQPEYKLAATIISVEHDTSGWKHLASLFPEAVRRHVSVELLEEPATPNLAIASHKPAYNLFELLKQRDFDEIHSLDRHGLAYYATQAKQLGFYFLDTVFAVHVLGGTLFRKETEDALLDDLGSLMDDMLERGSVERADAIFVHDRKAWQWYLDKIELRTDARIIDLAWAGSADLAAHHGAGGADGPLTLIHYGPLGANGGLPLFCDIVGRVLPKIKQTVEVLFVGAAQAVGGMDAISYIRLRAAKWAVPVTIKRDLSIADELDVIVHRNGVVICNTVRLEHLRARLLAGAGIPMLHVARMPGGSPPEDDQTYPAIPGRVAQALLDRLDCQPKERRAQIPNLVDLWRAGRPPLPLLTDIPAQAPLQLPGKDQPKVSVCITHFSRPEKLRTALATLKKQTYQNFEVIVVDDGSPDAAVQSELAKIKREIAPRGWRVLVQENRYLGAARNFGASHATGDYLIFMDDDNAAKPNEISTLVGVARRTGAEIVTTFYDAFETESDLEHTTPAMRFTPFGADPTLGVLTNCFGDANALYAREMFERLGGFTEDYGITHEDWEFFCRASLEGVKLVCVPEPLFWYRVDQNGMYRGEQTQLHKNANLRRHIRPFLQKLPPYQARLVQLAQGLSTELPLVTVGEQTRAATPRTLREPHDQLPYARVAIITRTKDRPLLLRRAIRSALDQTFRDWLLVIVNDGGDPETIGLVVDEFADDLGERVLVVHHPISLGMQTAANAGLTSCDSDFIVIHDDDDSWEPTFLARTVSHLDDRGWNPRSAGVVTWSRVIVEELRDDGEIVRHSDFIFDSKLHNLSLIDLAIENRFPPISFLFRRAALEVVGPFREQHGVLGDWDFHLRVLRQFDIDVIPEPLANYHHRTKSTAGVYGNSVHVQTDVHRSKRTELLNGVMRGQLGDEAALPIAQLMAMGELQHSLLEEQRREFQRLHDYMWTIEERVKFVAAQVGTTSAQAEFQRLHDYMWMIEQRVKYINEQLDGTAGQHRWIEPASFASSFARPQLETHTQRGDPGSTRQYARNLVLNGDFRLWPGVGKPRRGVGGYTYVEVCPEFFLSYDGKLASYHVDARKWSHDGEQLPFGKSFLHIEHDGLTRGGSWLTLEYNIPSVLLVAGQPISISGVSRITGAQSSILVGGRYDLADGSKLVWPTQQVALSSNFERWSCTITSPKVQATELRQSNRTRILLRLPYDQHFEFDLTDFQIEIGATSTDFQYCALTRRQQVRLLWKKTKALVKQTQVGLRAREDSLNSKVSV